MLCNVAGCCGMLITMAPTLKTAALLVFSPRWALYKACDLAMLHLTTVLKQSPPNELASRKLCFVQYLFLCDEGIWMDVEQ